MIRASAGDRHLGYTCSARTAGVAEYRFFLQGTQCQSCHREFHTRGRLEDHLRATKKCVRVLRRIRVPGETAPPGYGSTGRRKHEADNYTPAVPSGGHEVPEFDAETEWNQWQKKLHAAMCDVLLEDPCPNEIRTQLDRKVRLFPLYVEEIQAVIAHLNEEGRLHPRRQGAGAVDR